MGDTEELFAKYVGRKKEFEELISAIQVQRMNVTLDREEPVPKDGDPVPPGWHHLYFAFPGLPLTRELGRDGRNINEWPVDPTLPMRMYAGSRARFHRPLFIGDKARCVSELVSVKVKQGRSGKLAISTYRHTMSTAAGVATVDEWDMVDREEPKGEGDNRSSGQMAPSDPKWEKIVTPTSVMLFRFSAVTFNAHRIHYDHPYSTDVEGYPGLLLHGPFTATLLCDFARDNYPGATMTGFEMRAKLPLFSDRPLRIMGRPREGGKVCDLWAVTSENTVGMEAFATFA